MVKANDEQNQMMQLAIQNNQLQRENAKLLKLVNRVKNTNTNLELELAEMELKFEDMRQANQSLGEQLHKMQQDKDGANVPGIPEQPIEASNGNTERGNTGKSKPAAGAEAPTEKPN